MGARFKPGARSFLLVRPFSERTPHEKAEIHPSFLAGQI